MKHTIPAYIKLRKDTLENWSTENPVLLDGEYIAVEIDGAIKFKIGDGVSTFSELKFQEDILKEEIQKKIPTINTTEVDIDQYADWQENSETGYIDTIRYQWDIIKPTSIIIITPTGPAVKMDPWFKNRCPIIYITQQGEGYCDLFFPEMEEQNMDPAHDNQNQWFYNLTVINNYL